MGVIVASTSWMFSARVIRSQVISLREREFVKLARLSGAGNRAALNVVFAIALTAALFLVFCAIYENLRNRRGFGGGDIKFLAAAAAWTGLSGLPWILLIASISGLAFSLLESLHGRAMNADSRIAFGPHLSLGLLVTWLLEDMIMAQI